MKINVIILVLGAYDRNINNEKYWSRADYLGKSMWWQVRVQVGNNIMKQMLLVCQHKFIYTNLWIESI